MESAATYLLVLGAAAECKCLVSGFAHGPILFAPLPRPTLMLRIRDEIPTSSPNRSWAIWVYFPNRRRMKQSSTINSNISSPSEVECQSKLCWTKTRIAPRMSRGLSLVKNTRSLKDNLPLVASVSATAYILTRGIRVRTAQRL